MLASAVRALVTVRRLCVYYGRYSSEAPASDVRRQTLTRACRGTGIGVIEARPPKSGCGRWLLECAVGHASLVIQHGRHEPARQPRDGTNAACAALRRKSLGERASSSRHFSAGCEPSA